MTVVETKGYGACFYFAVICFLTGEDQEQLMFELKVRVTDYIIYNKSVFRNLLNEHNRYMVEEEDTIKSVEELKISILKETFWAGPLQVLATASYLDRPIQIFGCHTNGQKCKYEDCIKNHLHFTYQPLQQQSNELPITLTFVPSDPGFQVKKGENSQIKINCKPL